jgi:hypothetical protein
MSHGANQRKAILRYWAMECSALKNTRARQNWRNSLAECFQAITRTDIDSRVHAYEANTSKRPCHVTRWWQRWTQSASTVRSLSPLSACTSTTPRGDGDVRGRDSLPVFDAAHTIAIDPPCLSKPSPMSQSNGNCTSRRSRIDSVTASVHSMYFTAVTKSVCVTVSRPRTA